MKPLSLHLVACYANAIHNLLIFSNTRTHTTHSLFCNQLILKNDTSQLLFETKKKKKYYWLPRSVLWNALECTFIRIHDQHTFSRA